MLKTIIILLPFVLIAVFWAMAARERRLANDPSRKSFFQRNGAVFFVVLNASTASYPKLKDEFAEVVKSLAPPKAPEPAK